MTWTSLILVVLNSMEVLLLGVILLQLRSERKVIDRAINAGR